MNANGLIFNSVTQFVLQATRTKRSVKRNELDTLTEILVGPSGGENSWIGIVGTKHHDYNLMAVISSEVRRLPGLVSEVTVNYQGKLANVSGGLYVSAPTFDKYWQEGEVSYLINSTGPGGATGVRSVNRRYTGRCVDVSYITNGIPSGKPTGIGLTKSYLGFQNIFDILMGFEAGERAGNSGIIQQMCCTNLSIRDRADGWYEVKETYQSRMFPTGGGISSGAGTGAVASITSPIFKTDTYQQSYNQLMYNMNQSAQNTWDNYRQSVVSTGGTDPGTLPVDSSPDGQQTQQLTGVNPGWPDFVQGSASDSANGY